MHIILLLADLGDPVSQFWIGVGSLVLSMLAIAVTIIMAVRGRQRKLLTYEIVSNTSVINLDNDVGEPLELKLYGRIVTKVRLYVIKVLNAGNIDIDKSDYAVPPYFEFESQGYSRPVVRAAIHLTGTETFLDPQLPDQLKDMIALDAPTDPDKSEYKRVVLKDPPLLNPHQAIYLRVLVLADKPDSTKIVGRVQLRGGGGSDVMKQYTPPPTRLTLRFVVTGVLVAFVLGLLISNSIGLVTAFAQGSCSFGSIQDSGSTSFYSTAVKEAGYYNNSCPGQIAHITVSESSSGTGLTALEGGSIQIANSELSSPYSDLIDHQVAAIVFALVINKEVKNLSNLSTAQIQQIYSGAVTYWDQVDTSLEHIPIRIIGRAANSGTHAAFVKYVLGGSESPLPPDTVIVNGSSEVVSTVANTPGAIGYADLGDANPSLVTILEINQSAPTVPLIEKGVYPFWAIEHMYTRANPDSLTVSFIGYVRQNLQTSDTFIRLSDIDPSVLTAHT